jgi:hypothetical protein
MSVNIFGRNPNQAPLNLHLGNLAYQNYDGTILKNVNIQSGIVSATHLGIGTLTNLTVTSSLRATGSVSIANTTGVGASLGIGTVITITPYDTLNSGTLSFDGSAGQLFSITNNLSSGSIFSVNDIAGVPSIDVDANGTIELAPFGGNVGVGITNPLSKLSVSGGAYISGNLGISSTIPFSALDVNGTIIANRIGIGTSSFRRSSNLSGSINPNQLYIYNETSDTHYPLIIERFGPNIDNVESLIQFSTQNVGGYYSKAYFGVLSTPASDGDLGRGATFIWKHRQGNGASETMRLTRAGRLGIGSTSPSTTLDVIGNSYISGNLGVGKAASYRLDVQDSINIAKDGSNLAYLNFNGTATRIKYDDATGHLSFITNSTERAYVGYLGGFNITSGGLNVTSGNASFTGGPVLTGTATSTGTANQTLQVTGGAYVSGNVGIGTDNPTTKLDVRGVISVSAGTTSAPAIIPTSDSNTGVFFPSPDTFAVATNGTERIKVSAAGTFAFGGPSVGFSTNRNYHFYTLGNSTTENASFYFESTQDLGGTGLQRQYGIYVNQRGARYTNQTALYAEPLSVYGGNYRGVHGVTLFSTQAGGTTEAIFGETTIDNWNYQGRHCAVRGIAQGGSTVFSNTYGLTSANGAFGGHFVAYGKADVVGVYADAYQTASPGAGTTAVPLLVATNGTELMRVTTSGYLKISATEGNNSVAVGSGSILYRRSDGIIDSDSAVTISNNADNAFFWGLNISANTIYGNASSLILTTQNGNGVAQFEVTNTTLQFKTGSTERARFDATGNLGIGTNVDPGANNSRLSVDSPGNTFVTINSTGISSITSLAFRNSNANGQARIINNTGGPLAFYHTASSEAMRLTAAGNVGIGTTNPTEVLTTLGRVQLLQDASSNSRLIFRAKPGNLYRWSIDNDGSNLFRIFREDDATAASGTVAMTIDAAGNTVHTGITTVGLGATSTPPNNSQMSFELTSNTNLRIKVRGTDGVLRTANITLA